VGTGIAMAARPTVNMPMAGVGCVLILAAIVFSACCYRILVTNRLDALTRAGRSKSTRHPNPIKGIILALSGGLFIGLFTPLLDKGRQGDLGLGAYAVGALFAFGIFISALVFDIFFMNLPVEGAPVEFGEYLSCSPAQHLAGMGSGAVLFTGVLGVLVCGTPEVPQIGSLERVLLAQGAPVVAALWGILVFREFKEGDYRVKAMGFLTPLLYLCGLALIGLAPMLVAKN
jgi:glucose uptake protein